VSYGTAIRCDQCSVVEFLDREVRDDCTIGSRWYRVDHRGEGVAAALHFCSLGCAVCALSQAQAVERRQLLADEEAEK
jgi:hypothetical protein